jgi:hypothetical protein
LSSICPSTKTKGAPSTKSILPSDGRALRVFTDIPHVEEFLTRPEFVLSKQNSIPSLSLLKLFVHFLIHACSPFPSSFVYQLSCFVLQVMLCLFGFFLKYAFIDIAIISI